MKPNKTDLQQTIELLIKRLEDCSSSTRFDDKPTSPKEDTFTIGDIKTEYSFLGWEGIKKKHFTFSMITDGNTVYRGIIGYVPILYTKDNEKNRVRILREESVDGIITVKHSSYSYSQFAIILFDKKGQSTWFASCQTVSDAASLMLGEYPGEVTVYHSETVYSENFLPEYYCEDRNAIDTTLQNTQTKRLEDLAEIIPGKSASSFDYQETGIPFIRARDIQNGAIVPAAAHLDPKMAKDFSKQLLQEGDILLTKHFGQRKLALVSEDHLPAIASEALFIIRPFGISEHYLYRYLTSKTGNTVFNTQLKRIEKGSIISSISLSDLKNIQIPLYDEETMFAFEKMDSLNAQDGIETALRIIQSFGNGSERDVEKHVYDEFVSAGWDPSKLLQEDAAILENGMHWVPDLSYTLSDNIGVLIEIKRNLSKVSKEWVFTIESILRGPTKFFYILTTGYYYEVHVTGKSQSLKLLHAPTVTEILDWERGLN